MISPVSGTTNPPLTAEQNRLLEVSRDLEASFLTEMLKSAGFGKTRDAFGGGVGEDQFSSFLVSEQAKAMTQVGGIGLAEKLFASLQARVER